MPLKTGFSTIGGYTSLVELIQKEAEQTFDLHHESIFASDAAFCSKKSALHLATPVGQDGETSSASTFYFGIGEAVHEIIDKALAPVSIATELSIRHPLGIGGRLDNIIIDSSKNIRIIDTKTCGKLPIKPKPSHVNQVLTYCLISGIEHASLLYVSRSVADWSGTLKIVELPIIVDFEALQGAAETIAESAIFAKDQVIPAWVPKTHKSHCGWCSFQKLCWAEDKDKEQAAYNLLPEWEWLLTMTPSLIDRREKVADRLVAEMPKRWNLFIEEVMENGNKLAEKAKTAGLLEVK